MSPSGAHRALHFLHLLVSHLQIIIIVVNFFSLCFRYNPVQCPYCNKGHRDNYNLKQHVCPVLNMKYGVFEKSGKAPTSSPFTSSFASILEEKDSKTRNLLLHGPKAEETNGKSSLIASSQKGESS